MLIHTKLPAGHIYPQLTQFPANYPDFLAAFQGGQTLDNNTYLTTGDAVQTHLYKAAIASGHLRTSGSPIERGLLDIFLTDTGAEHILALQDRQFCELAVELAKKSVAENDGKLHPYVGAVIVKDGKVISTGYRGETGEGRHAEYCALSKLSEDVDKVDLTDCTVYTTLEPCSIRNKPSKTPCTNRLINGEVERVVYGLADKDETVYGHFSLSEAGIEIGLFPKDLIQELLILNKQWSDTRRKPAVLPPPNNTNAIAHVTYHKPGDPMEDAVRLYVRPPTGPDGFYTIEDAANKVLAQGRTLEGIGVKWREIDTHKTLVEKLVRQNYSNSSGSQLLNFS